jgi:hypothetical protein
MTIQSVIFDKDRYDIKDVYDFLKHHNIKPIKAPHITENYIRMRISPPNFSHYITKDLHNGVKIIIGL